MAADSGFPGGEVRGAMCEHGENGEGNRQQVDRDVELSETIFVPDRVEGAFGEAMGRILKMELNRPMNG